MNIVFRPYADKFGVIFIDGILGYSSNRESHKNHLMIVLQTLREHKLVAKFSKFELWLMKYLF